MEAWTAVEGIVVRGQRLTSNIDGNSPYGRGTLELQAVRFKERGLDLDTCFRTRCFHGTINVSISPRTRAMLLHEPTFREVNWHPDHQPENFYLSECQVLFRGKTYSGWVYYPDPATKVRHFQDDSLFEIIAEFIPKIGYGHRVAILFNSQEILVM